MMAINEHIQTFDGRSNQQPALQASEAFTVQAWRPGRITPISSSPTQRVGRGVVLPASSVPAISGAADGETNQQADAHPPGPRPTS